MTGLCFTDKPAQRDMIGQMLALDGKADGLVIAGQQCGAFVVQQALRIKQVVFQLADQGASP